MTRANTDRPAGPDGTPGPAAIHGCMAEAMKRIGGIPKSGTNEHQHYKFRGIDDVYARVQSVLAEVGVCVSHAITEWQLNEVTSGTGAAGWHCIVFQVSRFTSVTDGSFVETDSIGESLDYSDKGMNKAMTQATKYALVRTFCIGTADEHDADRETPEAQPSAAGSAQRMRGGGRDASAPPLPSDGALTPAKLKKLYAVALESAGGDQKIARQAINAALADEGGGATSEKRLHYGRFDAVLESVHNHGAALTAQEVGA